MDPELLTKYQKLDGKKEPGTQCHNKSDSVKAAAVRGSKRNQILIVITLLVAALLIAAGIGIGVGFGIKSRKAPANGLTITMSTQQELEGEYYELDIDRGIKFKSHANLSFFYLKITATNGDPVIIVRHPPDSFLTMMTVNNVSLLVTKDWVGPDEMTYTDYVIPNFYVDRVNTAFDKGEIPDELFQMLDREYVNETREDMLENLAVSTEGLLIIKAAKTLGDLNINGTNYHTAMRFYLLALQLAKIVNSNIDDLEKRGFWSDFWDTIKDIVSDIFCTDLDSNGYCRSGYPDESDKCLGLCGNGCCCWHWVCGDCCVHRFCLEHDICCAKHGYLSVHCAAVLLDLPDIPCSQGYDFKC